MVQAPGVINMKKIFVSLLLAAPFATVAAPSSSVAWTPEKLRQVAEGNVAEGQKLAITCVACHGDNGVSSISEYPSLAGQLPTYLYKQLRDYAGGTRVNPIMNGMSAGLSDQDMVDLAAWYGSLPTPAPQVTTRLQLQKAERLIEEGDENRMRVPCVVCHGSDGEGAKMDIPALAGQNSVYLENTLKAYRDGSRANDIYARMRILAKNLTDQEINELANYYQGLD